MAEFDNSEISQERLFKTLVIGNSGVGKTATIVKYTNDEFPVKFQATLGMDFQLKTVKRKDETIRLQIWVRNAGKIHNVSDLSIVDWPPPTLPIYRLSCYCVVCTCTSLSHSAPFRSS